MTGAAQAFDVRALPAQRWKNGAGTTREIACSPPGAGIDDFDWRLSVAEVDRDAPFSAFPGIDRCIVLLDGAGMRLHAPDGSLAHTLERAFVPWTFRGEAALEACLRHGPTTDFNVMVRRGRWRAEVLARHRAGEIEGGVATAVLCGAGRWRIDGEDGALQPLQGLLWRAPVRSLHVSPTEGSDAPCLVVVRLCHDRA
jgi:uncharacterized protein